MTTSQDVALKVATRRAPITRRPPGPRRLSTRVLVALAVGVVIVAAAVWAVFFSSLLDVRTVEVQGLATIDRQSVLNAAEVALGGPLARLDSGSISTRVAAIPAVADVDVSRSWPHTVVLTIRERTAAIAVPDGGAYAVYDATGVRFLTTTAAPPGVTQLHLDNPPPSAEVVGAVLEAVRALPPDLARRVTTIRADTLDNIEMAIDDGAASVVWGSSARSPYKAAVLVALMKKPASVYDVSAPDLPTTRE